MAAMWWPSGDEGDVCEERDGAGERGGLEQRSATVLMLPSARRQGPGPVALPPTRAERRRTFRKRRVLALMLVGIVGAVVWSAFDRLVAAASGAPVGVVGCTVGPSSSQSLALASAGAGAHPSASLVTSGLSYCDQVYVARPGDTLWGIALRYSGTGDPRPLADSLEAQISGRVLQPGQRLAVP